MAATGPLGKLTRSLLVVRPSSGQYRVAARQAAAVGAGLVLASLVFGPTAGALGLTAAMACSVARDAPLRRRVATIGTVGAVTVCYLLVGMTIGSHSWLLPPVATGLTLVGVWGWHALRTGDPGPINMLFAVVYGQHVAQMGYRMGDVLPPFLVSWVGAFATTLLLFALDINGPVREAVEKAEEAVSRYRDRDDDLDAKDSDQLRTEAHAAVEDAWSALHDSRIITLHSTLSELQERLAGAHANLIGVLRSELFPTAPLDVVDRLDQVPHSTPPAGYLLRTASQRSSLARLVSFRAGLAVLLASSVMFVLPAGRPYWAVLTALIVLHNAASRSDLTVRAIHRVLGTALGVLVYFGAVHLHAGPWWRLVIVIASIYCMYLFSGRNYALGVVFVTTYALLMVPMTPGSDTLTVMWERVLETVIGAVASVLAIWLVGRRAPMLLVRGQFRRTLRAIEAVLDDQAAGENTTPGALGNRRNLAFELRRAAEVLGAQRADNPSLAPWRGVQEAVYHFGYDVLASSWRRLDGEDRAAFVARSSLHWLIGALPPVSTRKVDEERLRHELEAIRRDYLDNGPFLSRA